MLIFVSGRSHDKSFTLFRLGQRSSPGVKVFTETGRSDVLEEQSQGEGGIYDEFNAPPISTGVGRTEAEFFVDGNHSRVNNLLCSSEMMIISLRNTNTINNVFQMIIARLFSLLRCIQINLLFFCETIFMEMLSISDCFPRHPPSI